MQMIEKLHAASSDGCFVKIEPTKPELFRIPQVSEMEIYVG